MEKWSAKKTGNTNGLYTYKVVTDGGDTVFKGHYAQCAKAAAAHNAQVDMFIDRITPA